MPRVPLHILVTITAVTVLVLLSCQQANDSSGGISAGDCLDDDHDDHILDENRTDNFSATLKITQAPPFSADETHTLIVEVNGRSEEYPNNTTADVMLGLDSLDPPECVSVYANIHVINAPGSDIDYLWTYWGILNITLMNDSSLLFGNATVDNNTLNLSYELDVLPPRVHLMAWIDLPYEDQWWPEHEWVAVPILLENVGGAPGTNLVLDFRYDGRIAATEYINLIHPTETCPLRSPYTSP